MPGKQLFVVKKALALVLTMSERRMVFGHSWVSSIAHSIKIFSELLENQNCGFQPRAKHRFQIFKTRLHDTVFISYRAWFLFTQYRLPCTAIVSLYAFSNTNKYILGR